MSIIEKAIEKAEAKERDQTPPKKSNSSEKKQNANEEIPTAEIKTVSVFLDKHENAPLIDSSNTDSRATSSNIISINREKLSTQGFLGLED